MNDQSLPPGFGLSPKDSIKLVSDLQRLSHDQLATVANHCINRMVQLSGTAGSKCVDKDGVNPDQVVLKAAFDQGVEDFNRGLHGRNPYAFESWRKSYDDGFEMARKMKHESQ